MTSAARLRIAIVAGALGVLLLPSAYMAWRERAMAHFGFPHDDALYYVTAKSLAQGGGYRILSLPDQPWQTKYPPLLPLGLSIVWRLAPRFPENLAWATLFAWVWLPVWLALAYRVFRDLGLEWRVTLGLCGLMALNQHVDHFAMRTQPELLFAVLWTSSAALVVARPKAASAAMVAGILAGAAYLTKTAGLPLLGAAPLYYVLRKQHRAAAAFALAMLPAVVGWNLWTRAHLEHSTDWLRMYYTDYLGYHLFTIRTVNYGTILLTNLDALLTSLGGLLLGWAAEPGIAERIAGVLMIMGTVRHCRRVGLTPYHLFAAGYVALLVIWHYPPDERFLIPVLPVFLAGLWTEARQLWGALRLRSSAAAAVFATACAAFLLYWGALGWTRFPAYFADFRALQARIYGPAYDWIARSTPADASFLASEDALLYLHTGRRAMTPIVPMRFFYNADRDGAVRLVQERPEIARERGLGYIFDAPRDWWRELLPNSEALSRESHQALARSPEVKRVWSGDRAAVYEVLGDAAAGAR